jgi:hypothetical protein
MPEGKRPLGRPRRRREDNIKIDLREIGLDGMDWIHLTQKRKQGTTLNEPSGSIKCCEIRDWLSDSWLLKKEVG